jgi:hypothetical protein
MENSKKIKTSQEASMLLSKSLNPFLAQKNNEITYRMQSNKNSSRKKM